MTTVRDEISTPLGEAAREPAASVRDWISVIAGALGALLATLDISIVNSALPTIQGEVGASGTEGTWIATGYLVSEVVMIPLSAWLVRVFGMRTLLLACVSLFTLFSILCGLSQDLPTMILGRVGQGFFGGALIPTAQTIIRTNLPTHQIPKGMILFGLIVILGPIAGPVLGGWLTDHASWRWCFFVNIPVAAILILLLITGLPHVRPNLSLFFRADWIGIIGIVVGLSSLMLVLEEGQREQWFESGMIRLLSLAALLGLTAIAVGQIKSDTPVIKLSLMKNPAFSGTVAIITAIGVVFFGVLYLLPQFLTGISGYSAAESGKILALSGIPILIMLPILPRLLGKADIRLMVGAGILVFATGCFLNIHLSADTSGHNFILAQLFLGAGQVLSSLPLNQAAVGSVSREDAGDAAGLYSMARNLGGSFGLALLGAFLDMRIASHSDSILATVSANAPLVQDRIAESAAAFSGITGDQTSGEAAALTQLSATVHHQALVMSYSDSFLLLGLCLLVMIPMLLLLREPASGTRNEMH